MTIIKKNVGIIVTACTCVAGCNIFRKLSIAHCAPMEPAVSPVCDPNKEFGQPDKKGFNLINNTSWLSWHTFSNRCLAALVRFDVTALVGHDLA